MDDTNPLPWWRKPLWIAFSGFMAIAAYFLITEHSAHLFGALPYLLLLACPLMHIFGHGGHRHSGASASSGQGGDQEPHRH